MQEDENIQFDTMPDFGGMFSPKQDDWVDEKVYNSLYDELMDKCKPDKFIEGTLDGNKFKLANQMYAEFLSMHGAKDEELIAIRNRAMRLLNIHNTTTSSQANMLSRHLRPSSLAASPHQPRGNSTHSTPRPFQYPSRTQWRKGHQMTSTASVCQIWGFPKTQVSLCSSKRR